MNTNTCVVAGGGICGLFASILLAEHFEDVYVVEKESRCGGLLKSVEVGNGLFFDQGTHVPNTTMIPEIDDILFGDSDERAHNWHDLGWLRSGNYFAGKWNLQNQMIDVRNLPDEVYQKGIVELLTLTSQSTAEDIVSFLSETLGPTFTLNVIAPIAAKLYGDKADLSQLMTNSSVSYFGLSRVNALDPTVSKKLKELPVFDDKLSYHNREDFVQRLEQDQITERNNYYPKNNLGVGYWVNHLQGLAEQKGVKIVNQEWINRINSTSGQISSIELGEAKQQIPCDFLCWTAPPVLALKAANIDAKARNVSFRTACIFHFQVDKPLLNTESHYVWNWDAGYKGFRITLYPNMQSGKDKLQY